MPFEEPIKQDVQMSLGYGEQKNPVTGETFFHHGIDFSVNHYLLSAVATGTVSAIGSDAEHGIYQTIRYGKYEVTYRHLSNVFANFSQSVKAGQTIAISGDLLHMEVRFDGEEINPLEFLTMPSMANPLGIGNRCMPLATKVQNLLIADFLNYLAMRHQVYLSTMDEVLKKNSKSKP